MDYLRLEFPLWYLVGILVLAKSIALTLSIYKRRIRSKKSPAKTQNSPQATAHPDRGKMAVEIELLRDGGKMDEAHLRRMSAEEKALFEVQLIDALTKWPREDQHRLRSALIKHGYDENCARRVMRENVSDRVRASTLLSLLRPQSQGRTGDLVQHTKADSAKPGRAPSCEGSPVIAEQAKVITDKNKE
jgi:hypothetical protein